MSMPENMTDMGLDESATPEHLRSLIGNAVKQVISCFVNIQHFLVLCLTEVSYIVFSLILCLTNIILKFYSLLFE